MSATIVGAANFISKPSQSLGPMLGFALLSYAVEGGGEGRDGASNPMAWRAGAGAGAGAGGAHALSGLSLEERSTALLVCVAVPLVIVTAQCVLWRRWTLTGSYLKRVKDHIAQAMDHASAMV